MIEDRHRYRAWDAGCGRMFYKDGITFGELSKLAQRLILDNLGHLEEPEYLEEWYVDNPKCIWLQCWGRKDSQGALVFEGDIVELSYPDARIPYKERYEVRVGEYNYDYHLDYGWYLYQSPQHIHLLTLSDAREKMKVLGNIYESPELLETDEK